MNEEILDVIVVGAGIAGSVCAIELARAGHEVVLVERAQTPGAKNLSGGVLYTAALRKVFPDLLKQAPVERVISRNVVAFLNKESDVRVDYRDERLHEEGNAVSLLRAKFDRWLYEQCEAEGVMCMSGMKVERLLVENGQVIGIEAGGDEIRARLVIIAEGANSFLAEEAGLRARPRPSHRAIGVKSVIGLDAEKINDRFQLEDNEGTAFALVGDATKGLPGGGFMYTNRESISIGIVARLDIFARPDAPTSSELHDHLLTHPSIAPYLRGGELLEYGSHLVNEGGLAMCKGIVHPGCLLIGDAAGFTLNTGLTIRGMDLAVGSALAAAQTASEALAREDFSKAQLSRYLCRLRAGFVGQDMVKYSGMPHLLESPRLYAGYGQLLANWLYGAFRQRAVAKQSLWSDGLRAFKGSGLKISQVAADAVKAARWL